MGDWLDFGPFNDEDELEDDGDLVEGLEPTDEGFLSVHSFLCGNCNARYTGVYEKLLHRTVVDIGQLYPRLGFHHSCIAMLSIRQDMALAGVEETCVKCWGRETWRTIQRVYGYQRSD